MSNGRAERMVKTMKHSIGRLATDNKMEWDEAVTRAVFGYRGRPMRGGISPSELFYGVKPELVRTKGIEQVPPDPHEYRQMELLALLGHRTGRVDLQQGSSGDKNANTEQFQVGDLDLVAYGEMFRSLKRPALESKYYGPCTVLRVQHARYEQASASERRCRKPILSRRLVCSHLRNL